MKNMNKYFAGKVNYIHKSLRCNMINETILAIIIAFAISALLCPIVKKELQ